MAASKSGMHSLAFPLIGAAAFKSGMHSLAFPLIGAAAFFFIRLAGVYFDLTVPQASGPGDRAPR